MRKKPLQYIQYIFFVFILIMPAKLQSINDSTYIANKYQLIDSNIQILKKNYQNKEDRTLRLAQKTLKLSIENNYQEGISQSCFFVASIYDLQNNKDSAILFYESGLKYGIKENNKKAKILWKLTEAYQHIGNYSSALENCLILKDFIESGKTTNYSYQIYNLLALIYKTLMEYDLAFQNFIKSADLAIKNGNEAFAGVVYANIGSLLNEQNKLEEARSYFAKGVALEEKHKLYGNAGNSYTVIAKIYLKLNKSDSVIYFLQKAEKYNQKYENGIGLANTHFIYSKYYFEKGEYDSSIIYLNKTIDYASHNDLNALLSDAYKLISEIHAKKGNFKEAYFCLNQFLNIYANIFDVVKINKTKAIEQKLIQREKESELFEFQLEKQKTINYLNEYPYIYLNYYLC